MTRKYVNTYNAMMRELAEGQDAFEATLPVMSTIVYGERALKIETGERVMIPAQFTKTGVDEMVFVAQVEMVKRWTAVVLRDLNGTEYEVPADEYLMVLQVAQYWNQDSVLAGWYGV